MKLESLQAALGSAILLLNARRCSAEVHRHHHSHPRHSHLHEHFHSLREVGNEHGELTVGKRAGAGCTPPTDGDIVLVTPGAANKGWAMSPDQVCASDMYCPFACPPGKVMAQWQPDSYYTVGLSMVSFLSPCRIMSSQCGARVSLLTCPCRTRTAASFARTASRQNHSPTNRTASMAVAPSPPSTSAAPSSHSARPCCRGTRPC